MLVVELLDKEKRISGRGFSEERAISFEHANNMLIVKTNDSCVHLIYKNIPTGLSVNRNSDQILHFGCERGKKNDILLNFLHDVFIKSRCITLPETKRQEYYISVDIYPIQANGDLFRMCVAGINEICKILKLKTYFTPKFYGFCIYKNNILADPDIKELEVSDWKMNVIMKSSREMIFLDKQGDGVNEEDFLSKFDSIFNFISTDY